jgi:molybdate transport system ATP-binding protein
MARGSLYSAPQTTAILFELIMTRPRIEFKNVDVVLDGQRILSDITWRLRPGEHWAILGGNGSGKSTLLKLIRADLWPLPGKGKRTYALDGNAQTSAVGIKERIALVSPELQERYLQREWKLTAGQVIHSGFGNSDYVYRKPDAGQKAFVQSLSRLLGVEHLLARNVQQLSTGELRKTLIARALAGQPHVLILDEVCDGLDARSRSHLLEVIERVARAGTQILYTTHRSEEVISAITHTLLLHKGRILRQGRKHLHRTGSRRLRSRERNLRWLRPRHLLQTTQAKVLLRVQRAAVFLNRKKVLHVTDWEMRDSQNWVFFGANGAGKSTFLKLIFGDLHPAAGAQIQRFDFTAANSVWDLKRRLGYLAPDFQASYREKLTGAEVIASGFFSSVGLVDQVSRRQKAKVTALLDAFNLGGLAGKSVLQMSYGEFRKVLLLRALVHEPQILICDEPFDGLDPQSKAEFAEALERISRNGTRLIAVTHHWDDLPKCITHGLLLEKGRIVCQGCFDAVRTHPAAQRFFGGTDRKGPRLRPGWKPIVEH